MISRLQAGSRSPLIPLKQIPCVHLVRHVRELVAPAVCDDNVAAGLEDILVVGHLGVEELRRAQRGLVDHHGHALGLHALHDTFDGACAEVVEAGRCPAARAPDRSFSRCRRDDKYLHVLFNSLEQCRFL